MTLVPDGFARRKRCAPMGTRQADPMMHVKAKQARIEAAGLAAIKPIWERHTQFCAELLKGFSQTDLDAHQRVNEALSSILRQRRDPATQLLGFPTKIYAKNHLGEKFRIRLIFPYVGV